MPDTSDRNWRRYRQTGDRLHKLEQATGDGVAANMISVNRSRCVRLRFNRSSCLRCGEICPKDAVRIDESGISIDETRCSGCMLCASVCLSGGLEPERIDILSITSKLMRSSRPVLGCGHITGQKAHVQICCLGVLCEQYLALLSMLLSGPIQLNLSACGRCTNRAIVAVLQKRIESIRTTLGPDCIVIVEEEERLEYSPEGYDRRSFFSAIGEMTRSFISELSQGVEHEVPSRYGAKYVPLKRRALNRALALLPEDRRNAASELFSYSIDLDEKCSGCSACVAICPTGALKIVEGSPPVGFMSSLCTGCMLCSDFCKDESISLRSAPPSHVCS